MRILVTGAAGFIGPHVADALERAGHEVVRTDVRVNGVPLTVADLSSLDSMTKITAGVDAICHLGGVGDVYLALEEPYTAAAANVLGTANLLEASLRNGVKKVVFASTWEVYGKPQYEPMDEDHPCNPDHPYNITKLAAERLVVSYDRLKGLPAVVLRFGTAYGPGMRPNSVFSIFIDGALRGEDLKIKGDGSQSRQFTHACDIAKACVLALESDVRGEVFNTVSDESVSIRRLAELITRRYPVGVRFESARLGDVPSARVSSQRVKEILGWQSQIRFEDGLDKLIQWHEVRFQWPQSVGARH